MKNCTAGCTPTTNTVRQASYIVSRTAKHPQLTRHLPQPLPPSRSPSQPSNPTSTTLPRNNHLHHHDGRKENRRRKNYLHSLGTTTKHPTRTPPLPRTHPPPPAAQPVDVTQRARTLRRRRSRRRRQYFSVPGIASRSPRPADGRQASRCGAMRRVSPYTTSIG
ncbi:uncharacterized protein K452DRAFT_117856 [Aplosporella prunicola CBS 121167]|uniref:Uncharacterized protein n=1 Tax=Aplosporella prunicola CBS 121167 TaxID=1176127 RepID=A0A6A6AYC3_9PEZI|nr:uncharacterized protein K452DRAFT_117856 [Aplosporella prunicola CBS 121167]KAF2136770.1 hypothetical protein K452DRAFT_117856 [Aplosporella prunicola CBS 121167]